MQGWGLQKLKAFFFLRCYRPEDHYVQLLAFLKESKDAVEPLYYCLDLFGASNRVRDTWRKHGYDAISFDIKHNPSHDLCSEVGFKQLLEYGVKFLGLQGGKRGFDSCHSHLGHSFILVYLSFCDIYSRCLGMFADIAQQ